MSVVARDFDQLKKFNLAELYHATSKDDAGLGTKEAASKQPENNPT